MQLSFRHSYDGSPERVVALFRNPDFIADVANHAGARDQRVDVAGSTTRLVMTLDAPADVPVLGGKPFDIGMSFDWGVPAVDGSVRGDVGVDVKGLPVTVRAECRLLPTPAGAEGDYRGELHVRIPLVGGKVEQKVAPFITEAFAGIERRARDWLAR